MSEPRIIKVKVHEDGSLALLGYVTKFRALAITQADISTITYTITDVLAGSAISGHDNQSLTVSAVIYDTLQTVSLDAAWDLTSGYNFRHVLGPTAVPSVGPYQYEAKITMADGGVGWVKFLFEVIPTARS